VRSVVESFGKLSFDQQKDAFVQVQDLHEQSRSVKRAELEQQLVELGYRAPKKLGRRRALKKLNGAAKKANGAAHKIDPIGQIDDSIAVTMIKESLLQCLCVISPAVPPGMIRRLGDVNYAGVSREFDTLGD
jgi:hypothetical protein